VVEELEAWFFGDVEAICQADPKVSPHLAKQKGYRDPDAIRGGTCGGFGKSPEKSWISSGRTRKIESL
jgi:hypothetical protein